MSSSNCCFLTCMYVSQEAGQMVWYSHLFQNFPQFIVVHTVKGFGMVNKSEVDVFLELSGFLDDPVDVGNLISGSSAFSKTSLNIWKFTVHIFLKPGLENFEHYFTGMWDECNCVVVWAFFGIAFLWDWNQNWPFPVATAEFSKFAGILSAALSQHHLSGSELALTHLLTDKHYKFIPHPWYCFLCSSLQYPYSLLTHFCASQDRGWPNRHWPQALYLL